MEYLDPIRLGVAFLSGYFLTLSGSLCQLTTNNSLASPSTLGMDGLGVLAILLAQFVILLFTPGLSVEFTSVILFLLFFLFLYGFIFLQKKNDLWKLLNIKQLILLGLAFNLFIGAIFSIVQFLFLALNMEFPVGIWFGSFKHASLEALGIMLVILVVTVMYIKSNLIKFNLLNLGQSFASGLGVEVEKFQKRNLLLALLLTGIVICFCGVFSFIGLIVPHILRGARFFKFHMDREIMVGPILGGVVIAIIDYLCFQFTAYGAELPVGMVSSVMGAFVLLMLVLRTNLRDF